MNRDDVDPQLAAWLDNQTLYAARKLGEDYSDMYDSETADLDKACVATSLVRSLGEPRHMLMLDIDSEAFLIPSSTPGHNHLYVDARMTTDQLETLLDALTAAGIIEPGYANASKSRGYTSLRLPWVKKGQEVPA